MEETSASKTRCWSQLNTLLSILCCLAVWAVHEQVSIAALDVGDIAGASESINALKTKFPQSTRVKRLQGMKLEAQGR